MAAQLISAIVFYVLMIGILIFVGLMYRASVMSRRKIDQTLIDAALVSANAAQKTAETASRLAALLPVSTDSSRQEGAEHHVAEP